MACKSKRIRRMQSGGSVDPLSLISSGASLVNQLGSSIGDLAGLNDLSDEGFMDPEKAFGQGFLKNIALGPLLSFIGAFGAKRKAKEYNKELERQQATQREVVDPTRSSYNPYTPLMSYGGNTSDIVELEKGEVYRTPDGRLHKIPDNAPSHAQGGVVVDVPGGTEILGKLKPGNDKTYKQLGTKLKKYQDKYKNSLLENPVGITANTSNLMLNKIQRNFNDLFEKQQYQNGGENNMKYPVGGKTAGVIYALDKEDRPYSVKTVYPRLSDTKGDYYLVKPTLKNLDNPNVFNISNNLYGTRLPFSGNEYNVDYMPSTVRQYHDTGEEFLHYPKEYTEYNNKFAKGGKWIQKATASIKRRGTEGVCTGSKFGSSSCPPGSKRYNLAQTFRSMAHKRKKGEEGLYMYPDGGVITPEEAAARQKEYVGLKEELRNNFVRSYNLTDNKTASQSYLDNLNKLTSLKYDPISEFDPQTFLSNEFGENIISPSSRITVPKYTGEAYARGGLSGSKDRYPKGKGKTKAYPMVKSSDFAGNGRSYPIPTRADAVDALRLAGLHHRSDVKAKVYRKYPGLKKAQEGMELIEPRSGYIEQPYYNPPLPMTEGLTNYLNEAPNVPSSGFNMSDIPFNDIFTTAATLAPIAYNIGQGLQKPVQLNARDFQNPYAEDIRSTLKNRKFNINPVLERNRLAQSTYNYGLRQVAPSKGRYLANLQAGQIARQRADAEAIAQKQNVENQYLRDQALFDMYLGKDIASTNYNIADVNLRNEAAKRRLLGAGLSGLQQYAQQRQLMRNMSDRDKERLSLLNSLIPNYIYNNELGYSFKE
jgi:hypothetical protein